MATFATSSYGVSVVISEGFDHLPATRIVMVASTALQGMLVSVLLITYYRQGLRVGAASAAAAGSVASTSATQSSWKLWLMVLCVSNAIMQMIHYADNIARAVDYHEPYLLYRRYIISEMELTYAFGIGISVVLVMSASTLLLLSVQQHYTAVVRRARFGLLLYGGGGLLSGGHYVVDPPSAYAPVVNFSVTGQCIVAVLLIVLALRLPCILVSTPSQRAYQQTANTSSTSATRPMAILSSSVVAPVELIPLVPSVINAEQQHQQYPNGGGVRRRSNNTVDTL